MHLTDNFRCNFHAWNWPVWLCMPLSAIGWTMQFPWMKPVTCMQHAEIWDTFQVIFMQVSCMVFSHGNACQFHKQYMRVSCMFYACFMHVFMHILCMVPAHSMETCMSMCHSCTFYARTCLAIMHIPCIIHCRLCTWYLILLHSMINTGQWLISCNTIQYTMSLTEYNVVFTQYIMNMLYNIAEDCGIHLHAFHSTLYLSCAAKEKFRPLQASSGGSTP